MYVEMSLDSWTKLAVFGVVHYPQSIGAHKQQGQFVQVRSSTLFEILLLLYAL